MEQLLLNFTAMGIEQILKGVAVLVICLTLTRMVMKLVDQWIVKLHAINPALHAMVKTSLRCILYFMSILAAAGTIGIPVSSFVALFSVAGLAISLAIQGVLGNLAGGIIILASKPFTLGDFIEFDSVSGSVTEIGFLNTQLLSPEGKVIYVPNSLLYTSRIINYSASGTRRIDLSVTAGYEYSPQAVREAVMDAINEFPQIQKTPAPEVLLESYADSYIVYTVRVWVLTPDYLTIRYALNERMYTSFKKMNLEFPYPHINVHNVS